MIVAVIPARGGSKRIPRKNIRDFAGKPIMAWPIEAALESGLFDKVIVSTDDREIAEIARACGAETPFVRPETLADDFSGTQAVTRHALQWYAKNNLRVEYACCIYATAALVRPEDLRLGWESLQDSGKSFAFSVTRFEFPPHRAIGINQTGDVEPLFPGFIERRSQDLSEAYHDAGQFYWGKAKAFLDDLELYSSYSEAVVLPRYRVQDIDTEEDWSRAELMHEILNARPNGA